MQDSASEDPDRLKMLDTIVAAIRLGGVLEVGDESFCLGGRAPIHGPFVHEHRARRNGSTVVSAAFVRERIAWLLLRRREALVAGLHELLAVPRLPGPGSGYRHDVRTGCSDADAVDRLARMEIEERAVLERAEISLEGTALGQLLADGLWAGARYGTGAGPEGGELWWRAGANIRHVVDPLGRDESYSRAHAPGPLSRRCRVVDGLAIDDGIPGALVAALHALGTPTVRSYLQRGVPWYRYLLWRLR